MQREEAKAETMCEVLGCTHGPHPVPPYNPDPNLIEYIETPQPGVPTVHVTHQPIAADPATVAERLSWRDPREGFKMENDEIGPYATLFIGILLGLIIALVMAAVVFA
jgi:hypothetical protein